MSPVFNPVEAQQAIKGAREAAKIWPSSSVDILIAHLESAVEYIAGLERERDSYKKLWQRSDSAGEKHATEFLDERIAETLRADALEAEVARLNSVIADARREMQDIHDDDDHSDFDLGQTTVAVRVLDILAPAPTEPEKEN